MEDYDPTVLTIKRGDKIESLKQIHGWHWCRNERGEEIGRHVAGVGAVFPGESRSFEVSVEAVPAAPGKRRLKH